MTTDPLLHPFVRSWAVLLKTRKRDRTWVGTPVNVAVVGGHVYVSTPADTAKVKRLRNFPEVELTPCTLRGKATGPSVHGRARLLAGDDAAAAARALVRKYRIVHGLIVPLELRLKRTRAVYYEVTDLRAVSVPRAATAANPPHMTALAP